MLGDFEVRVLQKDSGIGCRISRNPTPIVMARLLPRFAFELLQSSKKKLHLLGRSRSALAFLGIHTSMNSSTIWEFPKIGDPNIVP